MGSGRGEGVERQEGLSPYNSDKCTARCGDEGRGNTVCVCVGVGVT